MIHTFKYFRLRKVRKKKTQDTSKTVKESLTTLFPNFFFFFFFLLLALFLLAFFLRTFTTENSVTQKYINSCHLR